MVSSSFKEAHREELQALLQLYREELLQEVVPFWESRVADAEYGGYFTCFTREGKLYDGRKSGWFVGRTMHTFAALYNGVEPRESWRQLAGIGRAYMHTGFYAGKGRFNHLMERQGRVLSGTTSIFTDHFATKGLYEYITACGEARSDADVAFAQMLTEKLLAHVRDPEVWAAEGIPAGMQKHAINFMTLITAQESRQVFGDTYQSEVDERVHNSLYVFANSEYKAPLEYVGVDGKPNFTGEGRLVDPGHTMESLWFSMHEGHTHGKPEYIARAGEVLDWVLERTWDQEYGGFYAHCDVDRTLPEERFREVDYTEAKLAWDDKVWWVQCEGLLALAMSALYGENEQHYRYFRQLHDYTDTAFRDREYGEWYMGLHRDGSLKSDLKGGTSKGPYHVPRCLMQLVSLLSEYLAQ